MMVVLMTQWVRKNNDDGEWREQFFLRLSFPSSERRVVPRFRGAAAHPQPLAPSLARHPPLGRFLALAEPPESPSLRKWSAPMAPSGVSPPTPGKAPPPLAKAAGKAPWPQRYRR